MMYTDMIRDLPVEAAQNNSQRLKSIEHYNL